MNIYHKLAEYLDTMPSGFPRTESGVELRILKRIYTPEEAELFLHLTLLPEPPRVIARRAGISITEATERLEVMRKKGALYSLLDDKGNWRYQAFHFVCGIWEFQVNNVDPGFAQDMEEYWPLFFNVEEWRNNPEMRVIPINKDVAVTHEVMSYEIATKLISEQQIIAVSNCICRQELGARDHTCEKPAETCMTFGTIAEFYIGRGSARRLTLDEALDKLKLADKSGLVLQPSNSKEVGFICCCCSCCCAVLRSIKRHPKPASVVSTPFSAVINNEVCNLCETCIDRCQMEAITNETGKILIDSDRCIGCGLCISTCPVDAIQLRRKPESEQNKVPQIWDKALINLAKDRGKLSTAKMVGMMVKSKIDRMLS